MYVKLLGKRNVTMRREGVKISYSATYVRGWLCCDSAVRLLRETSSPPVSLGGHCLVW